MIQEVIAGGSTSELLAFKSIRIPQLRAKHFLVHRICVIGHLNGCFNWNTIFGLSTQPKLSYCKNGKRQVEVGVMLGTRFDAGNRRFAVHYWDRHGTHYTTKG